MMHVQPFTLRIVDGIMTEMSEVYDCTGPVVRVVELTPVLVSIYKVVKVEVEGHCFAQ